MIKEAIETLVNGRSLSFREAGKVMEEIMGGEATPAQIGAFITALRIKGETVDEIAGLASVMREKAVPVKVDCEVVDTCGTGGDGSSSFNISTAAAFIVAGAGLKVAKHGNRAMSSHCGSADVLEALGVKIDVGPEAVAECIGQAGIGFMFAPAYHPAMKHAAGPRREIGIRTVFNLLGPLTNPARAKSQVIGVPNAGLGEKIALVLHRLGTKHSLVVHNMEHAMDELHTAGQSLIWEVNERLVLPPYAVTAEHFGLKKTGRANIKGGTPQENAAAMTGILKGERSPYRDTVVMNAAVAIVAGNMTASLEEAARIAQETIDSGKAMEKLKGLVRMSQSYA